MSLFHASLMTFLISMVPVLELRGAIPVGVAGGLSPLLAMCIAIVGNLVPIPFLIVFTRRVFKWLKTKGRIRILVEKLESRAAEKSRFVLKYAWIGLYSLVAIPLPGTGAWTGTLAASFLDMGFKSTVAAVCLGVLLAGIIMALGSNAVAALFV